MTVDKVVARIRTELRAHASEEFRKGVEQFFREPVQAYGVRAPEIKAIARTACREMKGWPAAAREKCVGELWKSGRLEECGVAIVICRRFAREYGAREFRLLERWIDRYVHNWANCDGVASWLLAAAIANEPALIGELAAWTRSRNRWKRRAAIVALLQEAKMGRHTAAVLETAGLLLEDADDMVRKGVGWVLKEAYPKRPKEVMGFLLPRAERTPRLVLRLAAEKMSAADRAALLAQGRG
jgi:3-methyladenine DNA glycosylase AlkD